MAIGTVLMIVLATRICHSTTAVEDSLSIRTSLKQVTILPSNSERNASIQDSQELCSYRYRHILTCHQSQPLLRAGNCATYNNYTKLVSILECTFFQSNSYNYNTSKESVLIPRNLSQLNDYMCGPLNRKGLVCSECANGFGPSVTSFGYRCANCTDAWYGVPLFVSIQLFPITFLYLIILVFHIRVTSPPMPCLIMCAQLILITFDPRHTILNAEEKHVLLKDDWKIRLYTKVVLSLYQVFNLAPVQNALVPYCISNKLRFIHIAFLGYISAFYPILLIFLTWFCVELHGRNFRPLVWLWRPFHKYFVWLRRGWNTKSDIIDVFTTFFFLTYSKVFYQTLLLITSKSIKNIELSGNYFLTHVSVVDQSIEIGSAYHLCFAIPGILISFVFNILPTLMLILYPISSFRICLLKCHLSFTGINVFLDKIYGCYRNGLDGGRDWRSFSGVYLTLLPIASSIYLFLQKIESYLHVSPLFGIGTLFFVILLTITIGKPYQKAYMNHLDMLLLSNFMILCYTLSLRINAPIVPQVLIAIPITVFIITTMQKFYNTFRLHRCHKHINASLSVHGSCNCFRFNIPTDSTHHSTANTPTSAQRLLQPTSTVITYGIQEK